MEIEGIFSAIFAGLVIGGLGRWLAPGKHKNLGLLLTLFIGIVGALVGGAVAEAVDVGFWLTFVIQLVAAALLVTLFKTGLRR